MPENQGIPEVYADFAQISVSQIGIFLGFRAINTTDLFPLEGSDVETPAVPRYDLKATVRLDHSDAKIFAIILKRSLKAYEEDAGEILLPPEFTDTANLSADEW